MAKSIGTSELLKAVNSISHFCAEDQQALLQVIEDYFDPDISRNDSDLSKNNRQ